MVKEFYSRPIRVTASGTAVNRDTRLSAVNVTAQAFDVTVHLNDGAGGQRLWTIEADNAAGSRPQSFAPPLRFRNGLYVEIVAGPGAATAVVNLAVVEPYANL